MLRQGQAFFTPAEEAAGVGRHLWFVLSDPAKAAQVVIANLSTLRVTNEHLGCTVNAREHPSISRASVLRCDMAKLRPASAIEGMLSQGVLQYTSDASDALVKKLQRSLCESRDTPNEVKDALRQQGLGGSGPG